MSPPVLSAGVVVVRRFDGEPRYLLLRAYNYWDFPKGTVEQGEDALQAAKREAAEEAGLTDLEFRWGRDYRETAVYGRGKVARYYLAESPAGEAYLPVSPELGRPEHHELRWLDYRTARERLGERLRPILEWAHATVSAA
ncbi:MAG: NUDIX domain-containing protein [Gammaproteobacteria bacterium]|nr:NUDIX domain-containing protein [Gammaproteobacteria bacterium]NIR99065.1 NUDIX domain-containing protein [Gammaproteobacteria bacterium]NIT64697.1 NUDIX domain-containing protein [Gammaproteobacteria bacterium]NIV21655.1 NUDIX domain-containing protein [Gammaproteobacteria bacterium]NIX10617.1 NUDIX domain-containing protein [Gammaproteobacteria bacterium]